MTSMWKIALELSLTLLNIIFKSVLNIVACILLARLLKEWLNLHGILSFILANYCISYMTGYILRQQLRDRLKKKELEERIYLDRLTFQSASESTNQLKFEQDWKFLLDDDRRNLLSSIIEIPMQNRWLFFVTILLVNIQSTTTTWNYILSLSRTIGLVLVLVSGSAIRYQTLFERQRDKSVESFQRWIVYSQDVFPVVSLDVRKVNQDDEIVFLVQSYQLNSNFRDYFYDLASYTCQNLIDWSTNLSVTNEKSIRLIWPLPTCRKYWTHALTAKAFLSKRTYRDFSFMPLVHSQVEEYQYEQSLTEINEERRKNQ